MKYEIKGEPLSVVICYLNRGEKLISESGAMSWMTEGLKMDTNMKGGLMRGLGRAFSGESVFLNTYTSEADNTMIAFSASMPGRIMPVTLQPGQSIIAQKGAFLAATPNVELKVEFKKKLGAGFFGGEGFILQRLTGPGTAFLELDGHIEEYNLGPGEKMIVDTGNVAMFDPSVTYSVEMVKGFKNIFFGGEGLFLTTLTGPGKVMLQTLPAISLAGVISQYLNLGK